MTDDLPVYPLPSGKRLSKFDWFPMYTQRFLGSKFFSSHDLDVVGAAVSLWCQSMLQDPAGTLPDDDVQLACMMGFRGNPDAWLSLRERGALYGFSACCVEGSTEVRLAHPVVTEVALGMVERDRETQGEFQRRSESGRVRRMRGQLKKAGFSPSFYADEERVLRVIEVLGGDRWSVANVHHAAVLVGEQEALDESMMSRPTGRRRR